MLNKLVATFRFSSYKEMQGQKSNKPKGEITMEDKKLLTNEELEKVAGGSDTLDSRVYSAFSSAEHELESIIDDQADANFRANVSLILDCCRLVLQGRVPAEAALNHMQHYCNQINIDHRRAPQNILDQLRSSLSR